MSELQSKKGYSEKAFYNIQNRQQQLADKILGLRYRLTCPPLQLTGPAASERERRLPVRTSHIIPASKTDYHACMDGKNKRYIHR